MTILVPPKGRFHYVAQGDTATKNAIYALVVSTDPTPDKVAHAEFLRRRYLGHKVISDVGPSYRVLQDRRDIVLVWEFQEVK